MSTAVPSSSAKLEIIPAEGRTDYGSANTAWLPTRRQRIAGSSATVTHSQVALPSGPPRLHVISHTPAAPLTSRTRRLRGQGVAGSSVLRSAAGINVSRTDCVKSSFSRALRHPRSRSKAGVV